MRKTVAWLLICSSLHADPLPSIGILVAGADSKERVLLEKSIQRWFENLKNIPPGSHAIPLSGFENYDEIKRVSELERFDSEILHSSSDALRGNAKEKLALVARIRDGISEDRGPLLRGSYLIESFLLWLTGNEDEALHSYEAAVALAPWLSVAFPDWETESESPAWIEFQKFVLSHPSKEAGCEFPLRGEEASVNGFSVKGNEILLRTHKNYLLARFRKGHFPLRRWINCDLHAANLSNMPPDTMNLSEENWVRVSGFLEGKPQGLLIYHATKKIAVFYRDSGVIPISVMPGNENFPRFNEEELLATLSVTPVPLRPNVLETTRVEGKWYNNKVLWWAGTGLLLAGAGFAVASNLGHDDRTITVRFR